MQRTIHRCNVHPREQLAAHTSVTNSSDRCAFAQRTAAAKRVMAGAVPDFDGRSSPTAVGSNGCSSASTHAAPTMRPTLVAVGPAEERRSSHASPTSCTALNAFRRSGAS
jgi:hypothetical protein